MLYGPPLTGLHNNREISPPQDARNYEMDVFGRCGSCNGSCTGSCTGGELLQAASFVCVVGVRRGQARAEGTEIGEAQAN
jgi:hypothetical protein